MHNTDGCFPGASRGMSIGYACPEAAVGGPLCLLRNGDRVVIDISARRVDVDLSDADLEQRKRGLPERKLPQPAGALVGSAHRGATTHSGNVAWPVEEPGKPG